MPLVENYRIPEIRAGIEKAKASIARLTAQGSGAIPESYRHVDASRAMGNQLAARQNDLRRLQGELVTAMTASGAWSFDDIIERMDIP